MTSEKRKVNPLTSELLTNIKLKAPAQYAAGAYGVKVALEHAIEEMGAVRAFQTLAKLNQKNGIDCPGCAWPDPDDKRSVLGEYCENGAKAIAEEATLKRVTPDFFAQYSVEEMSQWSDYKIGKSGRLTHPMVLREGSSHYEKIAWMDAFKMIADELNGLDSPDEAVFYTSGRSSNEAAFLYGVFIRAFGTNNMPDCSNMCHESSGKALSSTLGIGKGSVTLDDLHEAEVVMVIGQNPGTNHPRMLSALQKLKENGGKVITINPLEEAGLKRFKNPQKIGDLLGRGTAITDLFLQVKINEDIALLKAILKGLKAKEEAEGDVFDWDFIENKTSGAKAVLEDLEQYDLHELLERSGISKAELEEAVALLAPAKKIIICWAMGLTQHKNGVQNIQECVNLLLLKGSIGKQGAGTCPVRGHSNVQGDRTVGIVHGTSEALHAALKTTFGIDAPRKKGLDTVESVMAMHEGKAKVFFGLGGNFVSAISDTNYTAAAFQGCNLTVQVSTKLNRSHLITGKTALILPTLGRSEKDLKDGKARFVSVENSMGKVHSSQGSLPPASEHLMSEPDIIGQIAAATLKGRTSVDWIALGQDYALIRNKIEAVIQGFKGYNHRVKDAGFYLPNNARAGDFSKLPDGKAQFTVCNLPEHHLKADEYLLMTIRSHDQFNTTIYGLHDRYRGVYNERRVLFMHPEDMQKQGLEKLELVNIISEYDGVRRIAEKFHVVPYSIPKQNLATYFPEANVLIPIDAYADKSQTPISKSVKVRVEKRG